MFKKRNTDKKVDLNKDIETIQVNSSAKNNSQSGQPRHGHNQADQEDRDAKRINRYGLIEK